MNEDSKGFHTTKKNLILGCFCANYLLFILQGRSPRGSPSLLFQFLAWSQYQFRETKHLMFMIGWSTDSLRLHYYFWKLFKTKCFGFCCLSWQRSVELPAETKMGICCDFLFSYTLKFKFTNGVACVAGGISRECKGHKPAHARITCSRR